MNVIRPVRVSVSVACLLLAAGCGFGTAGVVGAVMDGGSGSSGPPADLEAPRVVLTSPSDEAIQVELAAVLQVGFSEPMEPASIDAGSFILRLQSGGTAVSGRVEYDAANQIARLTPDAPLELGTAYEGALTTSVRDVAGNAMQPFQWQFTTVTEIEPPVVVRYEPLRDEVGVSLSAQVAATFDEALDPRSVGPDSFTLTGPAGRVPAPVQYESSSNRVSLDLGGELQPLTQYTAELTPEIHDVANNAFAGVVWRFTTSSAPNVSIRFPPAGLTDADRISVVGSAGGGAGGIMSVSVDGVAATSQNGFADWIADLGTGVGTVEFRAEVEDGSGVRRAARSLESMTRVERLMSAPKDLAVDTFSGRLLVVDELATALFTVDPAFGTVTLVTDPGRGTGAPLIGVESVSPDVMPGFALLGGSVASNFGRAVIRVDQATGYRQEISGPSNGSGPGFGIITGLALDAAHGTVYVADNYYDYILAVDLGSGARTELSGPGRGSGPSITHPANPKLDAGRNRLIVVDPNQGGVYAVDLGSGNRTVIADSSRGSGPSFGSLQCLSLDTASNRAFVVNRPAYIYSPTELLAVDLASGDRTRVSAGTIGSGPEMIEPKGAALAGSTLYLADSERAAVSAVDVATGARRIVARHSFGTGPGMAMPRDLCLNADGTLAYVLDDSWDGLRAILEINLATGSRRIVADDNTGSGTQLRDLQGIALDPTANRLLVTDASLPGILSVDPVTGDRFLFLDGSIGSPQITRPRRLLVDAVRNRAFVIDNRFYIPNPPSVVEVNLSTGVRRTVSGPGVGSGANLSIPNGIALDTPNNRLLVTERDLDQLIAIDLSTGDRQQIESNLGYPTDICYDDVNELVIVLSYFKIMTIGGGVRRDVATLRIGSGHGSRGPYTRFTEAVDTVSGSGFLYFLDRDATALLGVSLEAPDWLIVSK
ncbi:MAG: Ig-like domain-containing protein [Planctomycetes bacterium]|nr:Ig-like domain-containing protein [Planctomycetota bacterium]